MGYAEGIWTFYVSAKQVVWEPLDVDTIVGKERFVYLQAYISKLDLYLSFYQRNDPMRWILTFGQCYNKEAYAAVP